MTPLPVVVDKGQTACGRVRVARVERMPVAVPALAEAIGTWLERTDRQGEVLLGCTRAVPCVAADESAAVGDRLFDQQLAGQRVEQHSVE